MNLDIIARIEQLESKLDAVSASLHALVRHGLARSDAIVSRLDEMDRSAARRSQRNSARDHVLTPVERVIRIVSEHYLIPRWMLLSRSRPASIAWPRQVAMYLLHMHYGLSYPECARAFRRTSGAAVCAARRVANRIETEPKIAAQIAGLQDSLTHSATQEPGNNA
jgi:chromosomal replication initiation ATPase DnaA